MAKKSENEACEAFEDYAAAARRAQTTNDIRDGLVARRLWGHFMDLYERLGVDNVVPLRRPRKRKRRYDSKT
jgi:hypothetical protein